MFILKIKPRKLNTHFSFKDTDLVVHYFPHLRVRFAADKAIIEWF